MKALQENSTVAKTMWTYPRCPTLKSIHMEINPELQKMKTILHTKLAPNKLDVWCRSSRRPTLISLCILTKQFSPNNLKRGLKTEATFWATTWAKSLQRLLLISMWNLQTCQMHVSKSKEFSTGTEESPTTPTNRRLSTKEASRNRSNSNSFSWTKNMTGKLRSNRKRSASFANRLTPREDFPSWEYKLTRIMTLLRHSGLIVMLTLGWSMTKTLKMQVFWTELVLTFCTVTKVHTESWRLLPEMCTNTASTIFCPMIRSSWPFLKKRICRKKMGK